MSENQLCYVCNRWFPLAATRVTSKSSRIHQPIVAQCARCLRYVCSDHSEMLDLGRRWFSFGRRKNADLTMCCPFDPGVPLGDSEW
jgi:hypothetical protein